MRVTDSPAWLQVAGSDEIALYVHQRHHRLLGSLPKPSEQRPRFAHFIGYKHKNSALKQIFPSNNFGHWKNRNVISLRLDYRTSDTDHPLLISEADPGAQLTTQPWLNHKQGFQRVNLCSWFDQASPSQVIDCLHSRFLLLFSDLVCVFLDDFETVELCENRIISWCELQTTPSSRKRQPPKLLLVTSRFPAENEFYNILKCARSRKTIASCFSSVEVFHLQNENLSEMARYRRLREKITVDTTDQLQQRKQNYQDYSATHLSVLFDAALRNCASYYGPIFNCLDAARRLTRSSPSMRSHIRNFTRAANELYISSIVIVDYISTALIMDAYPPKMHLFDPEQMYACYENEICEEACFDIKSAIKRCFLGLFQELLSGTTALQLRMQCLQRHSHAMEKMLSNHSCWYCLGSAPEHTLPCSHSICDCCVIEKFGIALPGAEYAFMLPGCRICRSEKGTRISIKPPTAGVRVISVDGGGTRGALPAEAFCILQNLLGRVQLGDCFELALGTSSGGLVVLAVFALRWSPQRCSDTFDTMSRTIFDTEKKRKTFVESCKKYVKGWIADGIYDHRTFETFLQKICGSATVLFGAPQCNGSFTKCAVTTSAISDGKPYLVANYNGGTPGQGPQCTGYEILRPESIENEPRIWEAARATSAAPTYFTSFALAERDVMDAGVIYNNPSLLARLEKLRLWPTTKLDIFLSLGTGKVSENLSGKQHFRNFLMDGGIPRICRALKSKVDGDVLWLELVTSLDKTEASAYTRINPPLAGPVAIDNVQAMESLRKSAQQFEKAEKVKIAQMLLISSFYFELSDEPSPEDGMYIVRGTICCRINPFDVFDALAALGIRQLEVRKGSRTLLCIQDLHNVICDDCQRLRKQVIFQVENLDREDVCLEVKLDNVFTHQLSGFPQTMNWFVEQQRLKDAFGYPTPGPRCRKCSTPFIGIPKRGGLEAGIVHILPAKRTRLASGR